MELLEKEKEVFDLLYKRHLQKILSKNREGKTEVYWFEYADILEKADCRLKTPIEEYTNSALILLGILTENPENAWTFSDPGMNPEIGWPDADFHPHFLGRAYFVKLPDIIDYANAFKKNYTGWSIFRMKYVHTKGEVC